MSFSNSTKSTSPLLRDRDDLQHRADLFAQQLPRHDVGVVFQRRNQNLIAGLEARARKALRHQIHRLGRAADENDFLGVASIDEPPHGLAGAFIRIGGALAQRMNATMHVGMIVLVITADRIDHGFGPLAGRGVVQVHQRLAIDVLMQHREVATNRGDVELSRCVGQR